MSDNTQLSTIHRAVLEALSELGVSDPTISKTVVLTRGGYFVGHRFLFDGVQAIWLTSEGVIRVYADDGTLLRTVGLGQGPSRNEAA